MLLQNYTSPVSFLWCICTYVHCAFVWIVIIHMHANLLCVALENIIVHVKKLKDMLTFTRFFWSRLNTVQFNMDLNNSKHIYYMYYVYRHMQLLWMWIHVIIILIMLTTIVHDKCITSTTKHIMDLALYPTNVHGKERKVPPLAVNFSCIYNVMENVRYVKREK